MAPPSAIASLGSSASRPPSTSSSPGPWAWGIVVASLSSSVVARMVPVRLQTIPLRVLAPRLIAVTSPLDGDREEKCRLRHSLPWAHRPHHYYDAGYRLINTDWNPLYLVSSTNPGFAAGPEALAAWDPTKYGNYPYMGGSGVNWQSLPSDNWNDPTYHSRFTGANASCWPDASPQADA